MTGPGRKVRQRTFVFTEKQKKKFIELVDKDVSLLDAYKQTAPDQCKDADNETLDRRIRVTIFNRYPDIKEAYRRSRHRAVDNLKLTKYRTKVIKTKQESKKALLEIDTQPRDITEVTEAKTLIDSVKTDPIKEIQKAIALREAPPNSQDIYNMGRAMLLLAFAEIEARRQAIIELGKSPLDKDGSLFSYTIVPVIKCAVDMMLPFVRDKQNNVSESIMAAEIIKRSIAGFKENPDDYTAPIPDGVDTNAN